MVVEIDVFDLSSLSSSITARSFNSKLSRSCIIFCLSRIMDSNKSCEGEGTWSMRIGSVIMVDLLGLSPSRFDKDGAGEGQRMKFRGRELTEKIGGEACSVTAVVQ